MTDWKEWIDRYVREVARRLPAAARADVAGELRSLLEEEVEEAIAAAPGRPAEDVALERLKAFGEPAEVARRYRPERVVLIGPELYPTFRLVAGIVLGVYAAFTLAWATGLFHSTTYVIPFRFEFTEATSWMDVAVGALANLGVLVLIFTVVERWRRPRGRADSWNPRSLPGIPRPERTSRPWRAIGAAFGVFLLLALHFRPDWLGLLVIRGDEWGPFPVLDPNYRTFLPWLDAWILTGIAVDVWLVVRGRKDVASRLAEAAEDGFGAFVLWRILTDGPFTYLDVAFKPVIGIVLVVLVVAAVVELVGVIRHVRAAALEPRPSRA